MFEYSCKDVAEELKETVRNSLHHHNDYTLHIISNGSKEGERYIRNKVKVGTECGLVVKVWDLENKNPDQVIDFIKTLDKGAIIVQMPFFKKSLDDYRVIKAIPAYQDADGLTEDSPVYPATAQGIFTFLNKNHLIEGKHIVVIGRSNLVGRPLTEMLSKTNATVTMCHSKTENLCEITRTADVIVCAVGKRNFLTKEHIAHDRDVYVVDVGINFDEHGKLCGDVSKDVADETTFVTPVPGGVGLLTTATLMKNVIDLYNQKKDFK